MNVVETPVTSTAAPISPTPSPAAAAAASSIQATRERIGQLVRAYSKSFPKGIQTISEKRMAEFVCDVCDIDANVALTEVQRLWDRRDYVVELCKNRGIPQRTPEWYAIRKMGLTASDLAQARNMGAFGSREQLLRKKLGLEPDGVSSFALETMDHGVLFEAMALRCYRARRQWVNVYDFGLMPHPTIRGFGASPDGITEWGRLIEIKCPKSRPLKGEVPIYYYLQMQGQMAVTGLTETDYVETKIEVIDEDDFLKLDRAETDWNDCGIALRFKNTKTQGTKQKYSPENMSPREAHDWANHMIRKQFAKSEDIELVKKSPWKLVKIDIQTVTFDRDMWDNECVPAIQSFLADMKSGKERIDMGLPPWEGYTPPKERVKRAKKMDILPDFESESESEEEREMGC